MITDPIAMCELLVGLPDVNVLAVEDTTPLRVHIELSSPSRWNDGGSSWSTFPRSVARSGWCGTSTG